MKLYTSIINFTSRYSVKMNTACLSLQKFRP